MLRKLPPGVEWSEFHKNNKPWSEIDDLVVSIGSSGLQKRTGKALFAFPCCSCGALLQSLRESQNCSVFSGKRVFGYAPSKRQIWGDVGTNAKFPHSGTVCYVRRGTAELSIEQDICFRDIQDHKTTRCLCSKACSGDLPSSSLCTSQGCTKHLAFLSSFLPLERSDSTILFSLGGSELSDLSTGMKSGSLYIRACYNSSPLSHVFQ